MKQYDFRITGSFSNIAPNLKPLYAHDGKVIGFLNEKGEIFRLCLAIEKEYDGDLKYITFEKEMDSIGFEGLDYEYLDLYPALVE